MVTTEKSTPQMGVEASVGKATGGRGARIGVRDSSSEPTPTGKLGGITVKSAGRGVKDIASTRAKGMDESDVQL
jgi:hypothetical protein